MSTAKDLEQYECLWDLFNRVFWPIDGLIAILGEIDAHDHLLSILSPMVDHAKADLRIIKEILERSLGGRINIETDSRLRTFGSFRPEDFCGAFVTPQDVRSPQDAAQGGAA
jgi:hypothetical protein